MERQEILRRLATRDRDASYRAFKQRSAELKENAAGPPSSNRQGEVRASDPGAGEATDRASVIFTLEEEEI